MHPSLNGLASVVLDTNVALDWLVFRNPSVAALTAAVTAHELVWLACPAMRRELAHMLGHASLARWAADPSQALATFDALATLRPDPAPATALSPRCSDPDDQVFIDLAVACRARWLVTHDRALLKLARKARPLGVVVLRPKQWCAQHEFPRPLAEPQPASGR